MVSTNQSIDTVDGAPQRARTFWRGGRVWSCRLGGAPNRPARPPRQRALSPFFSLLPLWGGRCAARTLFFRTLNLHTVNWKRARSPIAPTCEPQVQGDAWFFASGHLSFVLNPSRRQQPGKIFLSFYFKIFVNSFRSRMVLHAWWGTIGAG